MRCLTKSNVISTRAIKHINKRNKERKIDIIFKSVHRLRLQLYFALFSSDGYQRISTNFQKTGLPYEKNSNWFSYFVTVVFSVRLFNRYQYYQLSIGFQVTLKIYIVVKH